MSEPLITSVPDFVERVLSYFEKWPDAAGAEPELWFRGVNDAGYTLLPGAYWRRPCDELSLFVSFQNAAPMYLSREPIDEWDWYYVMQHYGLPTRLLDWTESPLAALYFALELPKPDLPACVWVLDPAALNAFTCSWKEGLIIAPGDDDTKYWLPTNCGRGKAVMEFEAKGVLRPEGGSSIARDNRKPLAIFARRSSPRIVAQRGVFTVHGAEETPLQELLAVGNSENPTRLGKILIDPTCCAPILRGLRALGITRTTLFPEAQSVSDDLKRLYRISD
jgi:hypothetical protein